MAGTRRSTRRRSPSLSNTTPSTSISPLFSEMNSKATSPDSDIEFISMKSNVDTVTQDTSKPRTSSRKKRAAQSDSEDEEALATKPASKRRAVSQRFYVELKSRKVVDKAEQNGPKATATKKSKGKAPMKSRVSTSAISDGEDIVPDSDSGLEYNDDIQESDDSGSEFRVSDEDVVMYSSQESDSEEDVPISPGIVESATKKSKSRSVKRGATTDRKALNTESEAEMTDDEPLAKAVVKGSSGAKATEKGRAGPPSFETMTLAQLKASKSEERKRKREERQRVRAAEEALRQKIGRRLTPYDKSTLALQRFHPELEDVWGDLEKDIAIVVPRSAEPPAGLKITLLPFQRESLYWMKKQEGGPWNGGILADEMGMGKTIQMISLLVSDMQRPNLVIAPTVAIMQWKHEIETHSEGLKVLVWHGHARENDVKELKKYDVVLSTYSVMESCFRKQQSGFKRKGMIVKESSPLHSIKWNRVILDEAHNIKERSTNTAKAAFELKSKYRWCLSGTPLQNRVGELYSLVRFLGGDPFSYYFCKQCECKSLHWKFSDKRTCDDCGHSPMRHTCLWNHEILSPIQKAGLTGPGKIAFKKLKILLDRMMLRRTKIQRADDLGLPPRTIIVRRDYFGPEEKELYLSLFSDAKRQFTTYVDSGTVLNNYSNIFSLLTRMRQMACHPDLVLKSKNNARVFSADQEEEATVCRLCNDIAEDAIQSKCRHIFDRECIKQYLDTIVEGNPNCPVCHLPLTIDLEAPALELEENHKSRQGILGRLNLENWRSSSKIETLVEELSNLKKKDATTKSIVFSQFVSFLDLVAFRLQKEGFNICRLEGTMSPQARDATIQHFMNNVHVTVFLVSLKAGGVALNLTEASTVFLMDSWWNPGVEYQAMDRIHRLGQHRPVQAIKLVIEDSIESRIIQLQEKKSAMIDATLSADDQAMGRLTPADLGFLFRL